MNTTICKKCLHYDICKLDKTVPCVNFVHKDVISKMASDSVVNINLMHCLNIGQKEILKAAVNNISNPTVKEVAYRRLFFNESFDEIAENTNYARRTVDRYWSGSKNAIIFELIKMLEAKSK